MVLSISPAISKYCYLQLLAVSNSRSQGYTKYHPLPWKTYSEYRRRDNLSAWGQEAKHLHPSKQTKWVFILAEEGARRHPLYDLKAMYLGHLLTDNEICFIWSAVQNGMYCWAERIPLWAATPHFPGVVWSIWNGFTWCFCPRSIIPISRSSRLQQRNSMTPGKFKCSNFKNCSFLMQRKEISVKPSKSRFLSL